MHQGTALSPFSFAMVIDWLTEEVRLETPRIMILQMTLRSLVEENLERLKVSSSKTQCVCE